MAHTRNWLQRLRQKTLAFIALAVAICFTAVACSGGGSQSNATAGIQPELVADYIHTALASDRTAYTKHVVNRAKKLEGKVKEKGVLDIEATEGWRETDGIPLPAQMFREGALIASEDSNFTYTLISPWNINDEQGPKTEFERVAMDNVIETGEPYKEYQEVGDQKYFSALYPDKAVAEACITCHNTHPVHKERYPDKVFEMGEVMGGVMINIPLEDA